VLLALAVAWPAFAAAGGPQLEPWGRPRYSGSDTLTLVRSAYELCFSPRLRVSRWVAYLYTPTGNKEATGRGGPFRADKAVPESCRVTTADYRKLYRRDLRGYDKGHQAPDATLRVFGRQAQVETYLLSNITPQHSLLNQHLWKDMEDAIRDSTLAGETTWVVTGPVFLKGRDTLRVGPHRMAVPHGYFCTWRHSPRPGIVTLLVPNDSLGAVFDSATRFLVSVDSL
jgi:endonuclease G, mitochondrial